MCPALLRADAKAAPTLPRASATRCSIVDKLPHLLSTIRGGSGRQRAKAYRKETENKKNPRASSASDFLLTKGGVICQQCTTLSIAAFTILLLSEITELQVILSENGRECAKYSCSGQV